MGLLKKRPTKSGKAIVKGKRISGGGGFGLEIPCEYVKETSKSGIRRGFWLTHHRDVVAFDEL